MVSLSRTERRRLIEYLLTFYLNIRSKIEWFSDARKHRSFNGRIRLYATARARTFTSIVHRCSLNSDIGQEHLEFLLSRGFLKRYEEEGNNLHKTTEDAKVFLDAFREMYIELYNRGPEFKL